MVSWVLDPLHDTILAIGNCTRHRMTESTRLALSATSTSCEIETEHESEWFHARDYNMRSGT